MNASEVLSPSLLTSYFSTFVKKREYKWLKPRFALKHRPKVGLFKRIGWLRRFQSHWKAQIQQFYWRKTLGKTLYTDPNSGEVGCARGG
jgi:hypothetical protein